MTKEPLVSIIIPAFNRAHLISETLDSVLAQIYQNWECIVVDDGSSDGTDQLMVTYCAKDSRFQYHHRPADRLPGGNAARNYGFEVSKGEFIQWFDSDDIMHEDKLNITLQYALTYSANVVIDTHLNFTEKIKQSIIHKSLDNPEVFKSDRFYIDFILGKHPVITNNVLLDRNFIEDNRFNERLFKAQEFEFFSRLFENNLVYCFTKLSLSYYRTNHNSISKQTSKGNKRQIESLIYLSKLLQQRHSNNKDIVARAERQGRKTYKSLAQRKQLGLILKHFSFFKQAHHKNTISFLGFIPYNVFIGKGFDAVKPSNK